MFCFFFFFKKKGTHKDHLPYKQNMHVHLELHANHLHCLPCTSQAHSLEANGNINILKYNVQQKENFCKVEVF